MNKNELIGYDVLRIMNNYLLLFHLSLLFAFTLFFLRINLAVYFSFLLLNVTAHGEKHLFKLLKCLMRKCIKKNTNQIINMSRRKTFRLLVSFTAVNKLVRVTG